LSLTLHNTHTVTKIICEWTRVQRTNNAVESFQSTFGRLVKVSHPSFYAFIEYLQEVTLSNMADVQRLDRGGQIRRPKKNQNLMNDKGSAVLLAGIPEAATQ